MTLLKNVHIVDDSLLISQLLQHVSLATHVR